MARDFKMEYEEFRKKNVPEYWDQIEARLQELEAKQQQEVQEQDSSKNRGRGSSKGKVIYLAAKRFIPVAAGFAIAFVGLNALQRGQEARQSLSTQETMSFFSKEGDEMTVDAEGVAVEEPAVEAVVAVEEPELEEALAEGSVTYDAPSQRMLTEDMGIMDYGSYAEDYGSYAEDDELLFEEAEDSAVWDWPEDDEWEDILYSEEEAFQPMEDVGLYAVAPEATATYMPSPYQEAKPIGNERYGEIEDGSFVLTATQPLSTFGADVDTASYANVRRMIEDGYSAAEIYPGSVRIEEFVNYFSYDLALPKEEDVFGVTTLVGECPWNPAHQLLMIGVRSEPVDLSEAPRENLTFLLDVSGSMADDDKLPLVQKALVSLLDALDEEDTISIVTYANGVEVVLDSVPVKEKAEIREKIEGLEAEGGTNGEGGIQKAYELAEKNFVEGANNRILLATDGDLNIGISEPEELKRFITQKKDRGIFLSVLGFGTWNIRDDNMESLADCGNGAYHYIDSLLEARKVLVEEMGASLHTVAKDVKFQVEFNPSVVNAYHQLGYENRQMAAVDFRNDAKDGGEVGAGQEVVVLYEIIPQDSEEAIELTYGSAKPENPSTDYCTVRLRYKAPEAETSVEKSVAVGADAYQETPGEDFLFASAAAELAMVLREDPYMGNASLELIQEQLKGLSLEDEYRQEFLFLVRLLSKRAM